MKKNEKEKGIKYPLEDYSTEELHNMLRRPVQFKDFSRTRKTRIIFIRIFTFMTFPAVLILPLVLLLEGSPIHSAIAVTLSLTALIGNITHRDSAVIDSYSKEEIKAEIEYRKYKETAQKDIHRQILANQMER